MLNNGRTSVNCGRDSANDLVLEHPAISRFHATITLDGDGSVWIGDNASSNGTFLLRCGKWLQVERVMLCAGDRVRLGDCEVPIEQLTAVFGDAPRLRLGERQFQWQAKQISPASRDALREAGERLEKPRRNPVTGKIEENPSV